MKKILIVILINLSFLFAQSAGNSGLSFLKYGPGARNIGMSDLGVVSMNDPLAAPYNPALVNEISNAQVMFTHSSLIQDVSMQNIGAAFELFGLPFVVGVNTTSIPGIEVRTQPGDPQTTFDANYFYGAISSGYKYGDFSAGVTLKYLYENIFSDEATGFGFDFGLTYENIIDGLALGASIRNLGSMNKLRETETKLPVDLRLGAEYQTPVESLNSQVTIQAGYQKYTETDDNHIHFGAEVFYSETLALRGGYMTGYDSKGLTAGLGLFWGPLNFDYAYLPFEFGLGNSHIISITYNFL